MPRKKREAVGTLPTVTREATYPSLTGRKNKDGTPKIYIVRQWSDGRATCTCPDFGIGTNRSKDATYRCKHLELELAPKSRGQGRQERVPVARPEPKAPVIDILGDELFEPRTRRGR